MDRAIKLTWRERVGYCSGELAQNLIYQTVSIWLLFYYTNVYAAALSHLNSTAEDGMKVYARGAAMANAVHWVGMGDDEEYISSVKYVKNLLREDKSF